MPHITRTLLRRRAEHNEGMLSTLEEISLHQEELESINEVLGSTCRKLKILYLQNNIIPKMEHLHHMKDLQYLNLALNNITKIEGLQNCEFLHKLDFTVNFVDLDTLEESIDHLAGREMLREFYFLGNPAQVNWPDCNDYIIARLPQLQSLDGTEITRSMQIKARQKLPGLVEELKVLAEQARRKKEQRRSKSSARVVDLDANEDDDPNAMTENTPEERVKIYQELAQQKREKEERANANAPKERDYEQEHLEAKENVRQREAEADEGEIRQKNEGGWDFFWDEDSRPGSIVLEVHTPRFLDSSLIDVDVHPTYISIVIKAKLLRLKLPAEVQVSTSKCQRSKASGHLLVIMPKVNPRETTTFINKVEAQSLLKQQQKQQRVNATASMSNTSTIPNGSNSRTRAISSNKGPSIHDLMMQEALQANAGSSSALSSATSSSALLDASFIDSKKNSTIDVRHIVPQPKSEEQQTVFTAISNSSAVAAAESVSKVTLISELNTYEKITALD